MQLIGANAEMRNALLLQIRSRKQRILDLTRQDRERIDQYNRRLEAALRILERRRGNEQ